MIILGSPEETIDMTGRIVSEENQVPDNEEIFIDYVMSGIKWNRNQIDVDDIFACNVALDVINNKEDYEPKSIDECKQRDD